MNKNKNKNLLKVLGTGAGVLAVAGVAFTFIVGLNGATYEVNESDNGTIFTNPNSEVATPQASSAVSESSLNTTVGSLDSISPASTSTEKNAVVKEVAVTAQVLNDGSNESVPFVGEVAEVATGAEGEIEVNINVRNKREVIDIFVNYC